MRLSVNTFFSLMKMVYFKKVEVNIL